MLVISINHPGGEHGTESTVLGPFYVDGAPEMPLGANIIRRDVGGERTLVQGTVRTVDGIPIPGAIVDVWQTASNHLYDVQDPTAPEFNLRGKFRTDAQGRYVFVTEKPVSYGVPTDGPVGKMLKAAGRHGMRPAHVHFIVTAPGFRPLTTHVFVKGDPYLESDAVFATKDALVADFERSDDAALGARYGLQAPFTRLDFDFSMAPA
jgi:catechol 1,2-dioxygenase